jgi:hypothetical protein
LSNAGETCTYGVTALLLNYVNPGSDFERFHPISAPCVTRAVLGGWGAARARPAAEIVVVVLWALHLHQLVQLETPSQCS